MATGVTGRAVSDWRSRVLAEDLIVSRDDSGQCSSVTAPNLRENTE